MPALFALTWLFVHKFWRFNADERNTKLGLVDYFHRKYGRCLLDNMGLKMVQNVSVVSSRAKIPNNVNLCVLCIRAHIDLTNFLYLPTNSWRMDNSCSRIGRLWRTECTNLCPSPSYPFILNKNHKEESANKFIRLSRNITCRDWKYFGIERVKFQILMAFPCSEKEQKQLSFKTNYGNPCLSIHVKSTIEELIRKNGRNPCFFSFFRSMHY